MFRTALRNVLAHKGRLLMTALAVMLGTAFVAGTMVFSDTLGQAMKNSYSKSYSDISVLVTDNSAGSGATARDRSDATGAELTKATVDKIAALPGTAKAQGVVGGFTGVADRKGVLIGQAWQARGANFNPDATGQDSRYPMAQGRGPQKSGEIALDREAASSGGYHVGDTVRIAGNGPAVDAKLTGIFTTDDPQVSSGGSLTLMDTASAQQFLLTPGQFSTITVQAKPGVTQSALQTEVQTALPQGTQFIVQTGEQLTADETKQISAGMSGMKTMLLAFAGISLFVGIFIIANTFTMLVAQRTKELALLRAVGAGRWQVTKSVLVEALVIGLTASVAGLLAGIGIGAGMQSLMKVFSAGMPTGPLVVAPVTIAVALVVGVLVTVLSAVLPAIRASRVAPVAAMSSGDQPSTQKSLLIRNIIGSVITAGGFALIFGGASAGGENGRYLIAGGAPFALIGIFILLPLLSRPMIALVGPLLARLFGTPGKLARRNAVRNPRRTATTAAALTIGLTLVSAMTVLGASVGGAVDRIVTKGMVADYNVTTANRMSMSPELAADVAKAPGVAASSPLTNVYWELNGRISAISGVDAKSLDKLLDLTMDSGSANSLSQGQVLVSSERAKRDNLAVGSAVQIGYGDGTTGTVTVGGVFQSIDLLSNTVMSNAEIAKHAKDDVDIRDVLVRGTDGATAALQQSIKDATGKNPVIEVKSQEDMKEEFSKIISFALNMMYGLLAMSVLVAVLGVINTLAMSVFERKREIGMLRAIGLDRSGIKRMVRLESVVISLFGATIGVLLGVFLAWAVNGTLGSSIPGLVTELPYGQLLLFLLMAGLVGLVAALWPARRASKLDILESIKTD
ncbi:MULTISPECIES: ABC transporter permease [unclassified Kitasatospora]|uniref:ABC transporter permease n=1 Tax=unclassified Kitasatospora TaxID=2633591 RepID=UPI000711047F|nr:MULTISPECIES: ABC transporter permease [unclassified Kitasatospora]KQV23960.1 ABC transporter [Kitasatospora sp. Root107]KRB67327.1 ABC transporter [Kitasatospora sp. Root187]